MNPISVLVVDDSALMCTLLSEIVNAQPDMRVVGVAPDPYVAREKIKVLNPDVLTLDVEMPRMNGLDFLERLMRLRPMPVVMVSSLTEAGASVTLRALELGAVDYVAKPAIGGSDAIVHLAEDLADKIRAAAGARVRRYVLPVAQPPASGVAAPHGDIRSGAHEAIVAIGASTGGTEAIREVLMHMPRNAPPIVVAQHMPPGFTRTFAQRLNGLCAIDVKEAEDGERLLSGRAYVAPGHAHLLVARRGGTAICVLNEGERVNRHRPSVDVLFDSVAATYGAHANAVILTGMGRDGAEGMRHIANARGWTIAQNEETCVVFGMPRAAIETGCVALTAALANIAPALTHRLGLVAAVR